MSVTTSAPAPATLVPPAGLPPSLPQQGGYDGDPMLKPSTFHDDPDQLELQEAERALAAEEAAAAGRPAPGPAQPPVTAAPAANPSVPLPRFQEMVERARRAEEAAAYHEGRAAALQQQQPSAPAAPPQQPPEWVEAAAIEEGMMAATADYDAGSITAVEMEQRKIPLLGRLLKLHIGSAIEAMRAEFHAALRSAQPAPGIVDQQVMAAHVASLTSKHPWASALSDQEMNALSQMAHAEAAAAGKQYPKTPQGTMLLQTRVAELASTFGPIWHPNTPPPEPAAHPSNPAAPVSAAPRTPSVFDAGNRPNQADVRTALARAATLPPNDPASRGNTAGGVTLQSINTMTDEEIEALDPATLERLSQG